MLSFFSFGHSPDFVKQRLAKSDLFNWIKDNCTGIHEKNIMHIVSGWLKEQNYTVNDQEWDVIKKGYLTIGAFTGVGIGFPCIVLFAPTMRPLVYNTKFKKTAFWSFAALIGYINYNSAYQTFMYNMLQLNNSPFAYCSFQTLCLPEYKRFRNKWQSAYNLSAVAHRYSDFDLYKALKHEGTINMDLDTELQ